jgi:hypothetical protein
VHLWVERQCPGADAGMAASLVDMLVGLFSAPVTRARRKVRGPGARP